MTPGDKKFNYSDGVSLKEHLEDAIEAQREYLEAIASGRKEVLHNRIYALEKAVEKQEHASAVALERASSVLSEKLAGMVEQSMGRFPLRSDIDPMKADITTLLESRAELKGKASQSSFLIMLGFSIVNLGLTLYAIFSN